MPKSGFPWPSSAFVYPYWRNRHIMFGDTMPPSYPSGTAGLTTRLPVSELGATGGEYGGVYDSESRGIGYGESLTAPVANRPLYEIQSQLDMLFEKDDASINMVQLGVVTTVAPLYELDPSGYGFTDVVYLGPEGTRAFGGPDPHRWCQHYIKLTDVHTQSLHRDPTTGVPIEVTDVLSASGGVSFYNDLPGALEVYPMGTPGIIDSLIAGPPWFVVFVADPTGMPVVATDPVGLLNYSLLERRVTNSVPGLLSDAFITTIDNPVPLQWELVRDPVAAGWLANDVVYTTHYAYNPVFYMSGEVAALDSVLMYGSFRSSGFGDSSRFMDLLRLGFSSASYGPTFEIEEPASAAYGSFDYANALFRARDGTLKGTIGFDAAMSSYSGVGMDEDCYAGFLHRRRLAFANAATTSIVLNAPATYDNVTGTITLTGADRFWDLPAGADQSLTHIILGVDMVELYDGGGDLVGMGTLILWTANNNEAIAEGLDGISPLINAPVVGSISIVRPVFRTGGMLNPGGTVQGNVLVGDNESTGSDLPPLSLYSGGSSMLLQGFMTPVDDRDTGTEGGTRDCSFRVMASGRTSWGQLRGLYWGPLGAEEMWHHQAVVRPEGAGGPPQIRHKFEDRSIPACSTLLGDVTFRNSVLFDTGTGVALDRIQATTIRTSPNGDHGLSNAADHKEIDFASALVLGDPDWLFDPSGGPNYGGVIAGHYSILSAWPPGVGANSRLVTGLFAQGDSHTYGYPGLFSGIVEGNLAGTVTYPPVVGGLDTVSNRFEITWDGADPYRTMNYGWTSARTFYHNIPMPAGEPGVTPLFAPGDVVPWYLIRGSGLTARHVWKASLSGDSTAQWVAFPVNLPDGCTITDVTAMCSSTMAAGNWDLYLVRCPWDSLTDPAPINAGATALAATVAEAISIVPPALTVVNSANHYQIAVLFDNTGASGIELYGLRVTYTMQDFLPA